MGRYAYIYCFTLCLSLSFVIIVNVSFATSDAGSWTRCMFGMCMFVRLCVPVCGSVIPMVLVLEKKRNLRSSSLMGMGIKDRNYLRWNRVLASHQTVKPARVLCDLYLILSHLLRWPIHLVWNLCKMGHDCFFFFSF